MLRCCWRSRRTWACFGAFARSSRRDDASKTSKIHSFGTATHAQYSLNLRFRLRMPRSASISSQRMHAPAFRTVGGRCLLEYGESARLYSCAVSRSCTASHVRHGGPPVPGGMAQKACVPASVGEARDGGVGQHAVAGTRVLFDVLTQSSPPPKLSIRPYDCPQQPDSDAS